MGLRQIPRVVHLAAVDASRLLLAGLCALTPLAVSCGSEETDTSSQSADTSQAYDALSGVYALSEVTCAGDPVEVSVSAVVTFDAQSYLEEWSFPGAECEMALEGTMAVSGSELTLLDVEMSCSDVCADEGISCHTEPCSSDQTYQYLLEGGSLLLSFTQQGDEFACGACGDGVESSYLLTRTGDP